MAANDRLKVETCQICFDDFEVITLAGGQEEEEEDLEAFGFPPNESFFAPGDFYDDDELDQLVLALHLSTLDVPEEILKLPPPPSMSAPTTLSNSAKAPVTSSSSRPPLANQQRDNRPGTTRSSTSASTATSTSVSTSVSTSTSTSTLPPPYYPPEELGLGFSLPCNTGHLYCSSCLKRYIEMKLQSSVWPIVCANEDCKGVIPPAIVESLLGEKSSKWYDLSVERAVTNKVSTKSSLLC